MMAVLLLPLVFLLLLSPVLGVSINSSLFQGFENPGVQFRPKFRYWLPDASIQPDVLHQDIASIASVGAGGLELVPFYLYGDVVGAATPPTNWNIYGFGTSAFRDLFQVALEAANEYGLLFDFAVGASQGQGVPSVPGTPGLAVELRYGHNTIVGGEQFNGTVPKAVDFWYLSGFMGELEPFGEDKLVAVLAGEIASRDMVDITIAAGAYSTFPILETTLIESTVIDLTSEVTNGVLSWTPPTVGSNYTLIAFYERYTNQRSCIGGDNATDFVGNGSWIVDHFSAAGSKRTTDFLDQHLIYDEVKDLLKEVGEYSWEDSMEQQAALFWTPDFLQKFEAARGYSAVRYLPLFFNVSNQWGQELPAYNETWVYGEYDQDGESVHLGDYRTTLNEGYQEYLQHFNEWAESLGIKHSCQPAYNLPLNMLADVPIVHTPELESLGFNDNIDLYRQFVGPAHLQKRNVISTEVGAIKSGSYIQTVPELLRLFKDSFAAGINMMVIHGFSYTGEYPGTTWPGYTAFYYIYTEQWDEKQPAWRHLKDSLDYTARCQMVLQSGVPRVDLAFYLFEDPWIGKDYSLENLNTLGYTYEYLTADNLLSPEAYVDSGVLAPDGPAYKALVFSDQTQISLGAAQKLSEFAANGLPILFIGSLPTDGIGTNGNSSSISKTLASLLATYPHVQLLNNSSLIPTHLQDLGLNPRVSITDAASGLYTQWRSDTNTGLEMVFIFNHGPDQLVTFTFLGVTESSPYFLDAWTGKIASLAVYKVAENGISIDLDLKANQTKIIAFKKFLDSPTHVVSTTGEISGFSTNNGSGIDAFATGAGRVNLSDGRVVSIDVPSIPSINITNWSLEILSYHPSANTSSTANEISSIDVGALDNLRPWIEIPGLQQISGIGIYNSSFNFPRSPSNITATISFGPILNTIRVWVNDQLLPPIDLTDARVDVTEYLRQGLNTVSVEVSSTLFNAVKARMNSTMTAYVPLELTNAAFYEDNDYMSFGLLGPVEVTLMTRVKLLS